MGFFDSLHVGFVKWGKQEQPPWLKNLFLKNLKIKLLALVERVLPTYSHSLVAWNVLIHWGWGKVFAIFPSIVVLFPCFFIPWGINPGDLFVLAFGRIIDNRTLRLITESSHSSPKTDKDILEGNLRGNYFYLLDVM